MLHNKWTLIPMTYAKSWNERIWKGFGSLSGCCFPFLVCNKMSTGPTTGCNFVCRIFPLYLNYWLLFSKDTLMSLYPPAEHRLLVSVKGKVKVKLSLCLNWAPSHEGVLGRGGIAQRILDLGTRWRCQLHSLVALPPGKQPLVPIGWEAWWAPEPVWMRWWREKLPAPHGTRSPDHPARSPVLYHWAIPAPYPCLYHLFPFHWCITMPNATWSEGGFFCPVIPC
jgi:hypothetical protein